jgi:hypothetical protein
MVSITFPTDGITLNFLVEGEMGCFQCIEARNKNYYRTNYSKHSPHNKN